MNDKEIFLNTLYPQDIPENLLLLTWKKADKKSYWHKSINEILELEPTKEDIYIGCGLRKEALGLYSRGRKEAVYSIPGLWGDFDYSLPGTKEKNYPHSQTEALNIIHSLPVEPTIVLSSGNGLQAWWLWENAWTWENQQTGLEAQSVCTAWHELAANVAKDAGGFAIDNVSDLPRIMRLPGTYNMKDPGNPKLVKILESGGPRMKDYADFCKLTALNPVEVEADGEPKIEYGMPEGEPPASQVTNLWENDEKARLAWLGEEVSWLDDKSESARDMSIAVRAAQNGMMGEDIGKLLLAGRKHRNADLKHHAYYSSTIKNALKSKSVPKHFTKIDEDLGLDASKVTVEERLAAVSKQLGIDPAVSKITKTDADPAIYRIYWRGKQHELGGSSHILEQNRFRRAMADLAGIVVQRHKPAEWDRVAQAILNSVTMLKVGHEGHVLSRLRNYIDAYIEEMYRENVDWKDAALEFLPFVEDNKMHISLVQHNGLSNYIYGSYQERFESRILGGYMVELEWEFKKRSIRFGEDIKTRRLYAAPYTPAGK